MIDELIGRFSAETFGEWCREKFDRFTADPHVIQDAGDFSKAAIVGYVQSLPDADTNRPLLVMSVYAGEQIGERSSRRKQFDFARRQLQAAIDRPPAKVKGLFTQGLFAFHDSAGNFRLSLVSGRAEGKKLVYSDFKRQSFFVKPDQNNKTFRARMASPVGTYEQLTGAFSVETLTKAFYNELFAWYERAMAPASKVTFPNDLSRDDDDRNLLAEHLIRLITRLMFVWFIRQKDLVPEKFFDPTELKKLLKDFDPASAKQDNYYRAILQNLFFATLNCEIKERAFAVEGSKEENKEHYGIKTLYRYSEEFACSPEDVVRVYQSVPFLNGGLFECLDKQQEAGARSPVMYHDGFSREPRKCAHIPNNLFFDEHGLITLFARYDFTVDENAPNDTDVALDPELLGKVFENLLGAYNPETQETARKQSGSFYTPREIVNYMVDESLVAHLLTQAHEVEEPVIRLLLGGEEPPALPNPLRHKLVAALYHCRILDPACGSGAFPMGLLLKMVHLLQRLDPKNTLWHEVVMAETEKALTEAETLDPAEKRLRRQRITESFDQNVNQPDYARKLYLIENCIFGVDIQPIAVQIAKLRAFITLVCDQEPDLTDAARNYRMLPLPNLETKFVAANSLIGLSTDFAEGLKPGEGGSRLDDAELVRLRAELAEVRHQHFRARNSSDKNACRKHDRELRGKIKTRLVEIACKPDAAKIAFCRAEIEKLNAKRTSVAAADWHEITLTEDLLGDILASTGPIQTTLRVDRNKDKRDELDDSIRRNTRAIEAEQNRVKNKSAFQKEADTLAAWDPYDQNASSSFFDPAWMFGFKGGFDIVIGNPPYGVPLTQNAMSQLNQEFPQTTRIADSYVFFILRGLDVLLSNGVLSYITPNTFCDVETGEELRRHLLVERKICSIWQSGWAFDAAVVDTVVFVVQKACTNREDNISIHMEQRRYSRTVDSFLSNPLAKIDYRNAPERTSLLCKIAARSSVLSTLLEVRAGVILYEKGKGQPPQTERTLSERPYTSIADIAEKQKRGWKPLIRGGNVHRYFVSKVNEVVKYGPELAAPRDPDLFLNPKIVMRRTDDRLMSALDMTDAICVKSCHVMRLKSGLPNPPSLLFLLGVLNAKVTQTVFEMVNPQMVGKVFAEIKVVYVERLPVPMADAKAMAMIENTVKGIIAAKNIDETADTTKLESAIDREIYRLYNLTEDEIAIVEGRGASGKGTAVAAKPAKAPAARQPRKSVMTEDPDLS